VPGAVKGGGGKSTNRFPLRSETEVVGGTRISGSDPGDREPSEKVRRQLERLSNIGRKEKSKGGGSDLKGVIGDINGRAEFDQPTKKGAL